MEKSGVWAVIPAAGESKRFGEDKLIYPVHGIPLICRVVLSVAESMCDGICIILGYNCEKRKKVIESFFGGGSRRGCKEMIVRRHGHCFSLAFVENPDHKKGLLSSLCCGLRYVEGKCRGALVLLGDMPLITPQLINALIREWQSRPDVIVMAQPSIDYTGYCPKIIPVEFFRFFMMSGGVGRPVEVIQKYDLPAHQIYAGQHINYISIDTKEDLMRVYFSLPEGGME